MSKIAIAVLTRDNQPNLMVNLSHHAKLLAGTDIPFYIFDNSVNTDNSAIISQFPQFKYHKHDKDLSFDESVRYALTNMEGEYVWVLGDKIRICAGALPCIEDYMKHMEFSACLINHMHRLTLLVQPYVDTDRNNFMLQAGWHSTLLGSTIYHRDTINAVDFDRYMGSEFIHCAALFDGIVKNDKPLLVMTHSLTTSQLPEMGGQTPDWIPRCVEVWTEKLYEMVMKLPHLYTQDVKIAFCNHNGFNGGLLSDNQFQYLANHGHFNEEILDKYLPYLKQVCTIPEGRLRQIAKTSR